MNVIDSIINYTVNEDSDSEEDEVDENYIGYENFEENVFTRTGQMPLTASCLDGNVVAVKSLLRNGANPNMKDDTGLSPLHASCLGMNSLTIVKKLLLYGASVNTRVGSENILGETPLHYIVKDLGQKGQKQRLLYAQALLKFGADPSIRSRVIDPIVGRKTINAREYASLKGRKRLARIFRNTKMYKNRKRRERNKNLKDTILDGIVDFPPMLYAIFFTLGSGFATSGSHPLIAGLSLGVAVFLSLLYTVVGYQTKRYQQLMFPSTRMEVKGTNRISKTINTRSLQNLNRRKQVSRKYEKDIINYGGKQKLSRRKKKKLATKLKKK
jgi:hypothetical protein